MKKKFVVIAVLAALFASAAQAETHPINMLKVAQTLSQQIDVQSAPACEKQFKETVEACELDDGHVTSGNNRRNVNCHDNRSGKYIEFMFSAIDCSLDSMERGDSSKIVTYFELAK